MQNTLVQNSVTASDIASRLLPPIVTIVDSIMDHVAQNANTTLVILDPLVPYDTDVVSEAHGKFDIAGRSRAARLAGAVSRILRIDRQLATSEPDMLRISIFARILAQDAQAVPGASRAFFAQTTSVSYLEEIVREVDGALSYALMGVDDTPLGWHKSTIQMLQTKVTDSADWLQRLLASLSEEVRRTGSDVAARALRDTLARHMRQSGAGEKEAEVWLHFSTTLMEKCKPPHRKMLTSSASQLSLAILLAVKPLLIETQPLSVMQNRLASTITALKPSKGLPVLSPTTACSLCAPSFSGMVDFG
jgi:hypothetical protein